MNEQWIDPNYRYLKDEEIPGALERHGVTQFAYENFKRATGRNPTDHEMKWVGRWDPAAAVRQAQLAPAGRPDSLVSFCLRDVWEDVSLYGEFTVSNQPARVGIVTGWKSIRYHNGNDALWPMRTDAGEIIRSDGGHLIRSPTFRAPKYNVEPVNECTWPADNPSRGMWHIQVFLLPLNNFQKRPVPKHLIVEAHPLVSVAAKPKSEAELERRVAELENQLAAARKR